MVPSEGGGGGVVHILWELGYEEPQRWWCYVAIRVTFGSSVSNVKVWEGKLQRMSSRRPFPFPSPFFGDNVLVRSDV